MCGGGSAPPRASNLNSSGLRPTSGAQPRKDKKAWPGGHSPSAHQAAEPQTDTFARSLIKFVTTTQKRMSAQKQNKKDETNDQASARGFYVYCVGERAQLEPLFAAALPAAIEADARLELIERDALA